MLLGTVAGTLVASRKDEGLTGQKFLVVRELGVDGKETGGHVVAADSVGAGVGDVVLWASGSSARQTEYTRDRPCDAVIMAIVDSWEVGGREVYRKTPGRQRVGELTNRRPQTPRRSECSTPPLTTRRSRPSSKGCGLRMRGHPQTRRRSNAIRPPDRRATGST